MIMMVDMLLLFAAGRFLKSKDSVPRLFLGALLHTAGSAMTMLPGYWYLSRLAWRVCLLVLAALAAYAFRPKVIPKLLLFVVLHLSVGGMAVGKNELAAVLAGAAGITFASLAKEKEDTLIPVELSYSGQTLRFLALRDTGNTLRDPITGNSVLVVSAKIAQKLTGLSSDELNDPVGTMGTIPGLRLIPYQTVGNTGFLLALTIHQVKIGTRQGSVLVAFSPLNLGNHYEALTGGI